MSKFVKLVLVAIVAVAVVGVGGSWLYINVIKDDAPDELSFDSSDGGDSNSSAESSGDDEPAGDIDGEWTIAEDSIAGYRVQEVLFGQDTEAVGRTSKVTGSMTIDATTVNATEFVVDMATLESDEERRDNAFRDRVMATDDFPTATFRLSAPIELEAVPADGEEVAVTATGDLTLRGETKEVEFPLKARLDGDSIEVLGELPVVFEEWGIPQPGGGPITVEPEGSLEVLLRFQRA